MSRIIFAGLSSAVAVLMFAAVAVAQTPSDSPFPADPKAGEGDDAAAGVAIALPEDQVAQVNEWIEDLGSGEFARRELAAAELALVGAPVIPKLRRVARESPDAEVRLRADQIVKQLTEGDMESRITDFLAGGDVDLEGWPIARAILGDSIGIRELFVELTRTHAEVVASLEGTTRDRAMAMDGAVTIVQDKMFKEMKFPTRADAFALLLPQVDPNVPLNATFETTMLSVLHKQTANQIRRDAQLSGPFQGLLGRWMARSTLANRDDVLLFGMSWGLESTLPLALRTLEEANQTETLALSLQAIARFGDRDHVADIRPLLDDHRPASERGFARGSARTQLGDVAMAAIATLYGVPLAEIGFEGAESHPTYGFIVSDIGFPANDPEPRKAARAKIEKLLEDVPAAEGS